MLKNIPITHLLSRYTLVRTPKYRIGDDSDSDFKKINKQPAGSQITQTNALQTIDKWVHDNNMCLFMKGTPQQPMCGFSKQVVLILNKLGNLGDIEGTKNYFSYNVLSNPIIRQQLKVYSKWPTFPQLYVKGQLVGGCDIVKEMYGDGSLQTLLKKNNLIS